jgi:hypothetical protein
MFTGGRIKRDSQASLNKNLEILGDIRVLFVEISKQPVNSRIMPTPPPPWVKIQEYKALDIPRI